MKIVQTRMLDTSSYHSHIILILLAGAIIGSVIILKLSLQKKTASSLKLYKPKICACKWAIYKTGGIQLGTNQFLISGPSNFPWNSLSSITKRHLVKSRDIRDDLPWISTHLVSFVKVFSDVCQCDSIQLCPSLRAKLQRIASVGISTFYTYTHFVYSLVTGKW